MWKRITGTNEHDSRPKQAATCPTEKQWYHNILISRAHFLLSYSFASLCISCVCCLYIFLTDEALKSKLIILALILLPYHVVEAIRPQSLSLRSIELCGVVGRSALCGYAAALSIRYGLLWDCPGSIPLQRPAAFIFALAFFHFTEFVFTAISNPAALSVHSFLIEQGPEYWAANALSLLEYFSEEYLIMSQRKPLFSVIGNHSLWGAGSFLSHERMSILGFTFGALLVLCGEAIRKMAMFQAGGSFFHLLYDRLGPRHRLVTEGLYGVCRHPAYCGWFLWQLGMQLLLGTPICLLSHSAVTARFFGSRIAYEEMVLIRTFGGRYLDYMNKVKWTGVPFVRGAAVTP